MTRSPYHSTPKRAKPPPPPRNPSTESAVCAVIRTKKRVRFRYQGGERLFDPYVMWMTKAQSVVVHGHQVRNSADPADVGRHTLTVGNIETFSQTAEPFVVDSAFDFGEVREGVICCVTRF